LNEKIDNFYESNLIEIRIPCAWKLQNLVKIGM
jgi:hypothetical protein